MDDESAFPTALIALAVLIVLWSMLGPQPPSAPPPAHGPTPLHDINRSPR